MCLPGESCEQSNELSMDRAERATSDTSILFHLGELSQLSKVVPDIKMPENPLCSGVRRGSKSGSGVENRRGGGGGG